MPLTASCAASSLRQRLMHPAAIGLNQTAGAQQDTTVVTHDDSGYLADAASHQLRQHRFTRRSRRFAIV